MLETPRLMTALCRRLWPVLGTTLLLGGPPFLAAQETEPRVYQEPPVDAGVNFLRAREVAQKNSTGRFGVFHGFAFSDRVAASGITFVHRVVDDGAKDYKMVHYDHGNGIAVADVDGDRRLDLYFVNQVGGNELWRNLGGGRFENITGQAGVALADRVSVTASFADVDNDGDADLFVTTVKMGNALFENDGKGRFTDISKQSGLDHVGHSSGAVFFDYDRDGRLDLFVTNVGVYTTNQRGRGGYYVGLPDAFSGHLFPERAERSLLYRNLGGNRFAEVSAQVQLADYSWAGDATFTDFDGDLDPDLYVLNMQGDDHYYENVEGQRFVDRTAQHFPKTPWGAMGVKFFDHDNDGRPDLMITDMHSDMSQEVGPNEEKLKSVMTWTDEHLQGGANNIFGNAFYHNRGEGKFEEVSDLVGAENYWPWGFSTGDLNADGFEDVFIAASMNFPFRYGVNTVLLNNRGEAFLDSEFILGVEPRREGKTHKPWFDLDCSGADRGHSLCQRRELTGKVTVMGTLGSRASVIFDLDGDGDLDIVTNEFNSEPQVLISNLAEKKPIHFVQVQLTGKKSNRDGLGATVKVHAGPAVYTKVNDGKSGYLSQSRMPLYFGLGEAKKVDKIEVLWPSGTKQTVSEGIAVDSLVEIVEE